MKNWILVLVVVVAIASRFIITAGPAWANFSPLGALALYAGYHHFWKGWIATAIGVVLSNIVINNVLYSQYYDGFSWGIDANVILFAMISVIGQCKSESAFILNITSSLMFFILSNILVWSGTMYTHDMKGLIECYTAALPFLGNTLLSQFVFGGLFFGFHKVCISNINYSTWKIM
jgi:hypothetical protein